MVEAETGWDDFQNPENGQKEMLQNYTLSWKGSYFSTLTLTLTPYNGYMWKPTGLEL